MAKDSPSLPIEPGTGFDRSWKMVRLYLPRLALVQTVHGVRRSLVLPGQYEVRNSQSLNARIYRRPRSNWH